MSQKVSIIIPVYNVEKYIDKCVCSIIDQTYKNIEIILIDDGSTDSSGQICDSYSDSRVKVYHINNSGVSSARNVGLSKATGDYIMFVDSDDSVDRKYVELMVRNISNYQLACCSFSKIYDTSNNEENPDRCEFLDNILLDKEQCIFNIFDNPNFGGYLWNKIFISNIIKNNNIKFKSELKICEDMVFVYEYLNVCDSNVIVTGQKLYNYFQRSDSTLNSVKTKKWFSIIDSYNYILSSNISSFSKKVISKLYFEYLKILKEAKYESINNFNSYRLDEIICGISLANKKVNFLFLKMSDRLKYIILNLNYDFYLRLKKNVNKI